MLTVLSQSRMGFFHDDLLVPRLLAYWPAAGMSIFSTARLLRQNPRCDGIPLSKWGRCLTQGHDSFSRVAAYGESHLSVDGGGHHRRA